MTPPILLTVNKCIGEGPQNFKDLIIFSLCELTAYITLNPTLFLHTHEVEAVCVISVLEDFNLVSVLIDSKWGTVVKPKSFKN